MTDVRALLSGTDIFSPLSDPELGLLARHCELTEYRDGEVVFRAGSPSDRFFIVRSGSVLLTETDADGKPAGIARYIAGEYFGEMEVFENVPRLVDARAEGTVSLLSVPGHGLRFDEMIQAQPALGTRVLHRLLSLIAGRVRHANSLVSEKSPWLEGVRRRLFLDRLTGLWNRTYLDDELPGIVGSAEGRIALVMVKPDNFKQINDAHGHAAGDGALRYIAEELCRALEPGASAVRYHGDEYLVILPGADRFRAERAAETIKERLEAAEFARFTGGTPFAMPFSLGVAAACRCTPAESGRLVALAFELMMEARNSGGARIVTGSLEPSDSEPSGRTVTAGGDA